VLLQLQKAAFGLRAGLGLVGGLFLRLRQTGRVHDPLEERLGLRILVERLPVEAAGDRIVVMACGGLDETNIADVIAKTGVSEVHFTAFETVESEMEFRNRSVAMGSEDAGSEYVRQVTSAEKVRRVIEAVG